MTDLKNPEMEKNAEKILRALLNGASLAEVTGMKPEVLEQMYVLAYNLYTSHNYKDAGTIFKALCLYNGKDSRFWMGLAGSQQALGDYEKAIDSYQYAYIAENLASPLPIYYASVCLTKLNRKDDAIVALETLLETTKKDDPRYRECCMKSAALLSVLKKSAESK